MKRASIYALTLVLGGCASDAVRPVAIGTMRLSQGLQSEMTAFAARQNAEIAARRAEIAALDEHTKVSAFVANQHVMDWRSAGNDSAIKMFEQASSLPIGTQLAGKTTAALLTPAVEESTVSLDAKHYDALVKTLKPLADKRSPYKDVRFLIAYGQTVINTMKGDVANAADAGTGAEAPPKTETGRE